MRLSDLCLSISLSINGSLFLVLFLVERTLMPQSGVVEKSCTDSSLHISTHSVPSEASACINTKTRQSRLLAYLCGLRVRIILNNLVWCDVYCQLVSQLFLSEYG